jgi:cell wall-active antibiotic response 4TMS protein YvqF
MHINRGLLFWGLALVTAGVVALAAAQGWIDIPIMADLWNFWPVILIVVGLAIVLSRTPFAVIGVIAAALVVGFAGGAVIAAGPGFGTCGDVQGTQDTANGEFGASAATIGLEMNCGDLTVGLADGSAWQAVTTTEGDQQVSLTATAESLDIRSTTGGFPFTHDRQEWTITLGRDVEYDASLSLNAAEGNLDLSGGLFARLEAHPNAGSLQVSLVGSTVDELDVQLNAGSLSIDTDAETQLAGRIGVNAGSVDLCTDAQAGLRLTVDANVTFAHNLDDSGLQKSGEGTYTSVTFDSAARTIDLALEGNAASFTLNPEDGCS